MNATDVPKIENTMRTTKERMIFIVGSSADPDCGVEFGIQEPLI